MCCAGFAIFGICVNKAENKYMSTSTSTCYHMKLKLKLCRFRGSHLKNHLWKEVVSKYYDMNMIRLLRSGQLVGGSLTHDFHFCQGYTVITHNLPTKIKHYISGPNFSNFLGFFRKNKLKTIFLGQTF